MSARVLVADSLPEDLFAPLVERGVQVDFKPDLTQETLPSAIGGARVLIVRSTVVTQETIKAGALLSMIVRAGSGTNTIDVKTASEHGIYVTNCPGKNSVAVAELAFGLMIAADRRIPDNVADLRQGKWNKSLYSKALGLKGRVLGLVGFGAIAREVAARARAFGMKVIAFSRTLTEEVAAEAGVQRASSLESLFASAYVVSVHLPLTKDTRGLVSRALLERMPPDSILINTARAEVVDNDALADLARAKRIRVGTDVFVKEPEGKATAFEDALGAIPGVYGTHHIGASTEQSQQEIARATVEIVERFFDTGEPMNAVNVLHTPPAQGTLVVRHLDRVGVLASVLGLLKTEDINVETMENVIFTGGVAASARMHLAKRPGASTLEALKALDHVLAVELL